MFHRILLISALILFLAAPDASAQWRRDSRRSGPPRAFAGFTGLYGLPQGEFADFVDHGFGGGGHFLYLLNRASGLGFRVDGGLFNYGHETIRVPFSSTVGERVLLDLNTNNNVVYLGAGPQWGMPSGRVMPYINGTVGIAYFQTESSVEGTRTDVPFASTTNFDDLTFAWGGGAGLYIPVRQGNSPISIDLGVRYHDNGEARYLREGSIRDNPDGSIAFDPIQSEANLVSFHVGVSFALNDDDDDRDDRRGRRRRR